jgi:hypothetical protein
LAGEQLNALPGLHRAPFIRSIRRLSCEIGPIGTDNELAKVIRRLHRLILGLDGLEDLTLDFDLCDLEILSIQDGESTNSWAEACNRLLTTAVERCTSLMLVYKGVGDEFSQAHLVEREAAKWRNVPSLITRSFEALQRGLSLQHSLFTMRRSVTSATPEQAPPNLKALFLNAAIFMCPPHIGWAFHTLNSAHLTELYLLGIKLSALASALIFPCINIPTLEHLVVTDCVFPFNDFAKFLSRHRNISTLGIIAYRIPLHLPTLPKSSLPRLVTLHTSPENISHLLTQRGAFPRLAEVTILISLHMGTQFSFSAVENSLLPAAKRLRSIQHLAMVVFPLSRSDNWIDLEGADNAEKYPILKRIKKIAFALPRHGSVTIEIIPTWLSMFPLLQHIEFLNKPLRLDHESKITLLRRIAQKCAGIRIVKMDDETRDMSVWLSSDS